MDSVLVWHAFLLLSQNTDEQVTHRDPKRRRTTSSVFDSSPFESSEKKESVPIHRQPSLLQTILNQAQQSSSLPPSPASLVLHSQSPSLMRKTSTEQPSISTLLTQDAQSVTIKVPLPAYWALSTTVTFSAKKPFLQSVSALSGYSHVGAALYGKRINNNVAIELERARLYFSLDCGPNASHLKKAEDALESLLSIILLPETIEPLRYFYILRGDQSAFFWYI